MGKTDTSAPLHKQQTMVRQQGVDLNPQPLAALILTSTMHVLPLSLSLLSYQQALKLCFLRNPCCCGRCWCR